MNFVKNCLNQYHFIYLLYILIVIANPCNANTNPANGASISQIHVMFEWDSKLNTDYYVFKLWEISGVSSNKLLCIKNTANISFLLKDKLQFGKSYVWQIEAYSGKRLLERYKKNEFNILTSVRVNNELYQARVNCFLPVKDEIFFADYSGIAIDKKGKPVWFLPVNDDSISHLVIRDLKINSFGSVSYLNINGAFERKLDGSLIWAINNNDKYSGNVRETYHHDFKKMKDGSFMVCGSRNPPDKISSESKTLNGLKYNTIIHFEKNKSIRWYWDEYESLSSDSLFSKSINAKFGGHLNGFYSINNEKMIWMSFKNYSNVFLLDKESKKVVAMLNNKSEKLFQQQHGPFVTSQDDILIYNNNIPDDTLHLDFNFNPSVLLFSYNPVTNKSSLKWQYEIKSDSFPNGIVGKEGYASLTSDGNILVCPGGANFLVMLDNNGKKIWDCYFFKRDNPGVPWKKYSNYRCQSAASLYPLYATIAIKNLRHNKYEFNLHNTGADVADYRVDFNSEETDFRYTITFKSMRSSDIKMIAIPENKIKGKKIICTISSLHINAEVKKYVFNL